jgi:hypothetical protein
MNVLKVVNHLVGCQIPVIAQTDETVNWFSQNGEKNIAIQVQWFQNAQLQQFYRGQMVNTEGGIVWERRRLFGARYVIHVIIVVNRIIHSIIGCSVCLLKVIIAAINKIPHVFGNVNKKRCFG